MRNFMSKIYTFMQGRYGNDQLNISLFVIAVILLLVSRLAHGIAGAVLSLLELAVLALAIYRALSRNIYKRMAENRKFLPIYNAVTSWFSLTYKRFKEGKTHRYYKCPQCKAQLRVKNIKGPHTIKCPKCGNKFQKTIR